MLAVSGERVGDADGRYLSIWIPLDDTTSLNGTLEVRPKRRTNLFVDDEKIPKPHIPGPKSQTLNPKYADP